MEVNSLEVSKIESAACLSDFHCGVPPMDDFIHYGLQISMDHNYCQTYVVKMSDKIVALFALSFDSIDLDSDDREELQEGISSAGTPDVSFDYEDTFYSKRRYPALDIAYLAVSEDYRGKAIGTRIIGMIEDLANNQKLAGCQFLSVEAFKKEPWSAVGFYYNCGFAANEMLDPTKDTLRMFKTLHPKD